MGDDIKNVFVGPFPIGVGEVHKIEVERDRFGIYVYINGERFILDPIEADHLPGISFNQDIHHINFRSDGGIDVWFDEHENNGKHHNPNGFSGTGASI